MIVLMMIMMMIMIMIMIMMMTRTPPDCTWFPPLYRGRWTTGRP